MTAFEFFLLTTSCLFFSLICVFCVLFLPTDFVYRLNAFAESTSIDSTQIQLDENKYKTGAAQQKEN
jgi:hypothetical protein